MKRGETQPTPQAPNSAAANHPATQALTTPAVTAGEVCATQASPALPFGEFVLSGPDLLLALVLGLTLASGVVIVAWVFAEAAHAIGHRSRAIARFVRFMTRPLTRPVRFTRPIRF